MKSQKIKLLQSNQMSAAEAEQSLRRIIEFVNHKLGENTENLSPLRQPWHSTEAEMQEVLLELRDGNASYTLVRTTSNPHGRQSLSRREQEIARLIANGCPDKLIAQRLAISTCTVSTYVRRIFTKLDVNSRAEMVAQALAAGLL